MYQQSHKIHPYTPKKKKKKDYRDSYYALSLESKSRTPSGKCKDSVFQWHEPNDIISLYLIWIQHLMKIFPFKN